MDPRHFDRKKLSILIDGRRLFSDTGSFELCKAKATQQCAILLSTARMAHSQVTVSIDVLYHNRIDAIIQDISLYLDGPEALQKVVDALNNVSQVPGETGQTWGDRVRPMERATNSRMNGATMGPFYTYIHTALQPLDSRMIKNQNWVLFVTAYVPFTEAYTVLLNTSTAAEMPCMLTCIVIDSDAVGVSHAPLGNSGNLFHCASDPDELQAAIQVALGDGLLFPSLVQPIFLAFGAVTIRCVADRPYLACMRRCCNIQDFPRVMQDKPTLLMRGRRICSSGFELDRIISDPPRLVLEAVVPPSMIEESYLYDNSWVVRSGIRTSESTVMTLSSVELLDAAYTEFQSDVMIFRTSRSLLDAPHDMAMASTTFAAYFTSRSSLYLRQIIPVERRRIFAQPPPLPRNYVRDGAVEARMKDIRAELVAKSARPDYCLDDHLRCDLVRVASQICDEVDYFVDAVNLATL